MNNRAMAAVVIPLTILGIVGNGGVLLLVFSNNTFKLNSELNFTFCRLLLEKLVGRA